MGADAPRRTVSSNTAAKLLLILATLCILGTRPGFVFCRVISRLRSGAIWYQLIWVSYEYEGQGFDSLESNPWPSDPRPDAKHRRAALRSPGVAGSGQGRKMFCVHLAGVDGAASGRRGSSMLQGTSSTFPMFLRSWIRRCASAACANENVESMCGLIPPFW